jgi:hypothetical protein|tara:strand:- start:68 stop:907 length:840 start_codon:yes stop_codon:yes gene_type:complete
MGFIFREPLVIQQGTGVTVDPNNTNLFSEPSPSTTITISIGQDLKTTSDLTFNKLTLSDKFILDNESLIFKSGELSGSLTLVGSIDTTQNFNTNSNLTIQGNTTAFKIESELSQSVTLFESGSSTFGNSSDDTHQFSGSFLISGSLALSTNNTVREVSNDTSLGDSNSVAVITENAVKNYVDDSTDDINVYLRKCFVHTGSFVDSSTSEFTAVTASAPSPLTSTSESDFMFFINGQMMEHDALTVQQSSNTFTLNLNTNSLGYDLVSDDEIVAWGKFNS